MAAPELAARLERVVDHGAETRAFFLRLPAPLVFRPGQFISCLLPVGEERLIRPYSIASSPEEGDCLELVVDRVPGGPGSHYLFGLQIGATLRFTGPWGTFTLDRAPAGEAVFIADGTGIAPIRPMLRRSRAPRHTPSASSTPETAALRRSTTRSCSSWRARTPPSPSTTSSRAPCSARSAAAGSNPTPTAPATSSSAAWVSSCRRCGTACGRQATRGAPCSTRSGEGPARARRRVSLALTCPPLASRAMESPMPATLS